MLTTGATRLGRSVLVASLVVALAAGAHVLGGGHLPAPAVLATAGGVVLAVAAVATARPLGRGAALVLLGAGQLLLHQVFEAVHGCVVPSAVAATSHAAHLGTVTSGSVTCEPAGHASSASMLVAHAAATVVTALVLASTERAVAVVLGWVVPALPVRPSAPPAHRPLPVLVVLPRPCAAALLRAVPRRGPPAALVRP
ncbi:hypothetical protein [Cellulomonas massiliensis]|uniref:hypothetical protein n=1 Tax=Cellulomonas massiliensis TaxID=1465811 RepID=UPI0002FFF424|nr:hypothetical protein [Cellulomonas massiliensis]